MPPLLMRLLVPLLCFAAALIVRGEVVGDPLWHRDEDVAFLLRNLPYILLLLAMLLALLSHHAVEAGVILSMLCIYWLIQTYLQVRLETQPALQIYYLISLVAPCSIIFLCLDTRAELASAAGVAGDRSVADGSADYLIAVGT